MKWTKSEIEEYRKNSIQSFLGRAGNLPYDRYINNYGFTSFVVPNDNERFALLEDSKSFCYDFVLPEKEYETFTNLSGRTFAKDGNNTLLCPSESLAPILGVAFESTISGKIFCVPLEDFIHPLKNTLESKVDVYPHGDVNVHLLSVIKETEPYITMKELLDEIISYIGTQEFYFKSEVYTRWKYGPQYPELRSCYLVKKKK